MGKSVAKTYDSFKEFYLTSVEPLKRSNPDYLRLDGCTGLASRKAFAYFIYQEVKWKVDLDTHIEKLKIAYNLLNDGEEPFKIEKTKGGKGTCLVIVGQPKSRKLFYVYKVSQNK